MSGYQSKRDAAADKLQEPVANLWECLGRWSAYLVQNGKQADCAPPSWLVDAITNATTPPQREWVGLTDEDCKGMNAGNKVVAMWANRILKEKNT